MPDQTTIKIEGSFKLTHLKPDAHTFLIPLKDDVAMLIGQIVVYWGAFEVRMDVMIEAISERLYKSPPQGWKRLAFKKRKELFRDLMREYTAALFPDLTQTFDQICGNAADLHWRRNLVAHGYYELGGDGEDDEAGAQGASYTAHGEVKGKSKSLPVTPDILEKLWHDIAHLNGALLVAINFMGGKVSSAGFVIPDKDLLQDQQSGNFRLLAISDKF
ncbi:hypothetical protein OF122_16425 [Pelagibacterium flavum]|uniref:ApeA N-terminal domain-containing protein n=1 Tax=Pelagibacterium flavum TaxID=2984530 RepID=A0ABY6ILY5_9HYPH|nr:hypothetical protein [Pelagibacterium sp. YIM 151497]UYQ71608.1 hypothetical protein OF122_16425 [Pelagibacterium sp. YIM 151497]